MFKIDSLMAHVYEQRKDPDGFLYIIYTDESTYGAIEEENQEETE
jgi:hypothetical protein